MRRFWLVALLGFVAACAPTLTGGPATDPHPATLRLADGPSRVRFEAGPQAATLGSLFIQGDALRVNDTRCRVAAPGLVCTLNVDVPANTAYGLPVTGTNIHAWGTYLRDGLGPYTTRF